MLGEDFRYYHGRLMCYGVNPADLDGSHYFQTRRGNFNTYQEYIDYFWGNCYSKFDAEVSMDLTKELVDHGYFFKYNFDSFNNVTDNFFDYFVVLTEKEYILLHFTGVLTPHQLIIVQMVSTCTVELAA